MIENLLFRAKRIDNNEWVEGLVTRQLRKATDQPLLSAITSNIFGVGELQVDTNTICQYTGIDDMDGRKVFLGDIIAFEQQDDNGEYYQEYFIIQWDSNHAQYVMKGTNGFSDQLDRELNDFRVAGNIWDDKDLLKRFE